MVLVDDQALERVVQFFAERPDLDHAMVRWGWRDP